MVFFVYRLCRVLYEVSMRNICDECSPFCCLLRNRRFSWIFFVPESLNFALSSSGWLTIVDGTEQWKSHRCMLLHTCMPFTAPSTNFNKILLPPRRAFSSFIASRFLFLKLLDYIVVWMVRRCSHSNNLHCSQRQRSYSKDSQRIKRKLF